MREGWTYKGFEDCLNKAKKTKQVQTSEYNLGTKYPIISQEDKMVSGYCDDESLLYHINCPVVVFGDHTRVLKYVDFDFVVGADGVKILIPKPFLKAKFLYYYLQWYKVPSLGYSRHYKLLKEISLPIPSPEVQQRIVSELDLLSSIIEKKKAQLKEYDQLAQSIFYDMFGDPVANEKGWATKRLDSITKSEGGGTPSKLKSEYWNGNVIWVSSKDMKSTYISDSMIHITQEGVDNSPAHLLPKGTILIVNRSGILKHTLPLAITTKEVTINQDIKALVVKSDKITNLFLLYCLKLFSPFLLSKVKAVTVDSIDFAIIKKLQIPLPPLPLQQSFASKIEAIEHQKALIQQSITETETLFNSRMDYYFD